VPVCQALARWHTTNDEALRSRYLYRYSLEEPNTFSSERFLAIFQAVEGRISKSNNQFLSNSEFDIAEKALRKALPDASKLNGLIGKLRSNNSESFPVVLKNELPKLFDASGIHPRFDVSDFVGRIYLRRNKSSHGGARLTHEPTQSLLTDTLLLNAIYLIIECLDLGIDLREAVQKFNNAMHIDLPLEPAS
jgi:ApeA N-terminal domain 1